MESKYLVSKEAPSKCSTKVPASSPEYPSTGPSASTQTAQVRKRPAAGQCPAPEEDDDEEPEARWKMSKRATQKSEGAIEDEGVESEEDCVRDEHEGKSPT